MFTVYTALTVISKFLSITSVSYEFSAFKYTFQKIFFDYFINENGFFKFKSLLGRASCLSSHPYFHSLRSD